MGSTDPDASLREILDEDVPLFLAMTFRTIADRSDGGFETVEFVSVAEGLAAQEGINLARVVNGHPDLVTEYLGEEISFPDRTVAEFDRIVDEHYDPDETEAVTDPPASDDGDGGNSVDSDTDGGDRGT